MGDFQKKRKHMDFDFWGQLNLEESNWVQGLYTKFLNKESVPESWRYFFDGFVFGSSSNDKESSQDDKLNFIKEAKARILIDSYRLYGYLEGNIAPFPDKLDKKPSHLIKERIQDLYPEDMISSMGLFSKKEVKVSSMANLLKKYYCGTLVVEALNCSPNLREYIWQLIEKEPPVLSEDDRLKIYENLNRAVFFEEFLQVKYTGQKRFSLEGGEALIPMLKHGINVGINSGINDFVIGCSHRGRLNILVNLLGKPYQEVFMEFEDKPFFRGLESVGDVKYHKGFFRKDTGSEGKEFQITLLPNASHLESIDPIVEGMVYAKQKKSSDNQSVIPIFIHGDAAFSGQGIVYETLQFASIPGYETGGSLHIIVNNGIGFTANPHESRSTPYCTDIAKMFGVPVFRVNASDVEACLRVISYAVEIRTHFQCDVIIDFCCYRKFGHNEADDPSITQPLLYEDIRTQSALNLHYKNILSSYYGDAIDGKLERINQSIHDEIKEAFDSLKQDQDPDKLKWMTPECVLCNNTSKGLLLSSFPVGLHQQIFVHLGHRITTLPSHFAPHPKLTLFLDKRKKMAEGELPFDWGMAEALAFASLLVEGSDIRISGQDSVRGTFNQRQAVWYDIKTGDGYSPFSHLSNRQGSASFYNSPLSEYGVLGFEFGYGSIFNHGLVIWEAQFGDFANGAQIVFDQYISCAIQKWDFHSSLVMLLPHGYEGQGPEHSSARIERYLQLASEWNFRVAYPSTPVQYFCLLREHVKLPISIPLVIFAPKAMLRHTDCVSALDEFAENAYFKNFLEESHPNLEAEVLVFCTGKVYYDFMSYRTKFATGWKFVVVRIEALYPFSYEDLMVLLKKYTYIKRYVWLQEEPINMGAYEYVYMALKDILPKSSTLEYVGRRRSSSTAVGSYSIHLSELDEFMHILFCS